MDRCLDLASHLAAVQDYCSTAGSEQATALDFAALLAEVQNLAGCIAWARRDLTALGAEDIVGYHVPAATDELDAIVAHTAEATGTILDQCERIEEVTASTVAQSDTTIALARIYEACSFQDITGQRVAKVVRTLQLVEARIQAILRVFAPEVVASGGIAVLQPLLSGPQSPLHAMDQSAVDALLAASQ